MTAVDIAVSAHTTLTKDDINESWIVFITISNFSGNFVSLKFWRVEVTKDFRFYLLFLKLEKKALTRKDVVITVFAYATLIMTDSFAVTKEYNFVGFLKFSSKTILTFASPPPSMLQGRITLWPMIATLWTFSANIATKYQNTTKIANNIGDKSRIPFFYILIKQICRWNSAHIKRFKTVYSEEFQQNRKRSQWCVV